MIGTGSDACVNGLVLNGVFDTECDYTCMPGFSGVSTGGSSQFECEINGGTATTNYECTENNVTASKWVQTEDLPTVRSVHVPLCNSFPPVITVLWNYVQRRLLDDAATRTKLSCLPSGGATVRGVRVLLSSVTKNFNSRFALEHRYHLSYQRRKAIVMIRDWTTLWTDSLTYWRRPRVLEM